MSYCWYDWRTVCQRNGRKVKETPVRSVTFHANLERIAVINLDTGVEKKGEQIYYAAKLIEYPDESYQTTSL